MTRSLGRRDVVWVLAGCLAVFGLVGISLRLHRESLERANRFYREGRVERAEEIYRARAESERPPETAAYNLGTALMALGAPDAEQYLRIAAEGGDSAAAQRGYYNLGHRMLTGLGEAAPADSARRLLAAAVGNNRAALRLDPRDAGARWNLALAQLLLDSLMEVVEEDEVTLREDDTGRTEGGLVLPRVARLGPASGREREALAGDDPGLVSEAEALRLVQAVAPDMEALIRGMLWSHRPDVAPWAEPYPGGNR